MLRTIDLVLICAMIAAATVTYQVKHESELKLEEVRALQAAVKLQEDTIDLLKADWSLLNQPSRLQALATAFEADLKLTPIEAQQMALPDELPGKATDFAPVTAEGEAGEDVGPDANLKTGSVKP